MNRPHPPTPARIDIEGLRGLAVAMVVIHHLFPGRLPGGYLGVDVFFVISGYLITGMLRPVAEPGALRAVAAFWRRRVQRLLPALALVLATTLALGAWLLWPGEYRALGRHATHAAAMTLNLELARTSGYFDPTGLLRPLMHLWSLGVEAQFYLLWPILVGLAARALPERLAGRARFDRAVLVLAAGLGPLSLAAMLQGARLDPDATFFMPQARAWELLAGAAAAVWPKRAEAAWAAPLRTVGGLGLLAASALLIGPHRACSWMVIVPVAATVALLRADAAHPAARRLTGHPAAAALGRISYPLYLWHWPLLSLATIVESGLPPVPVRIAIGTLSLALAVLTVRGIERPVRPSRSPRMPWALAGLLGLTGAAGAAIDRLDGLPGRTRAVNAYIEQFEWDAARWTWSAQAPACRDASREVEGIQAYCQQPMDRPPEVALLGDSHALGLYPGLAEHFGAQGRSLLLRGASACAPLLGLDIRWTVDTKRCSAVMDPVLAQVLASPSIRTVVLAYRGPFYVEGLPTAHELQARPAPRVRLVRDGGPPADDNAPAYAQALRTTLEAMHRAGKAVVLVIDTPEFGREPRACVRLRETRLTPRAAPGPCTIPASAYLARSRRYLDTTAQVLADHPEVAVWDLPGLLCDATRCHGLLGDTLIYRDPDHLTVAGSRWLAQRYGPRPASLWQPLAGEMRPAVTAQLSPRGR